MSKREPKTRKLVVPGMFFLVMVATTAWGQAPTTRALKIKVKGMVCAFCAQGLTKSLQRQKAVAKVDVFLDDGAVVIQLHEHQALSPAVIRELVRDAGFEIDGDAKSDAPGITEVPVTI